MEDKFSKIVTLLKKKENVAVGIAGYESLPRKTKLMKNYEHDPSKKLKSYLSD